MIENRTKQIIKNPYDSAYICAFKQSCRLFRLMNNMERINMIKVALKVATGRGIFSSVPSLPAWSFQDVRDG